MMKLNRSEHLSFFPNLVTLFNLFTGFLSLIMADRGKIVLAGWLLILSLVWDSLDGNLARLFKSSSELGKELDSLADIVSFVTAPVFIISRHLLKHTEPVGLFFLFLYLGAGAYRLARFNVKPAQAKSYFEGLPTPAAAVTVVMFFLACRQNGWDITYAMPALLAALSFLMVSRIPYGKIFVVPFAKWQFFLYLAVAGFIAVVRQFNIETGLALMMFIFLLAAPLYGPSSASSFLRVEAK